jgi:ribonuclease P protein component
MREAYRRQGSAASGFAVVFVARAALLECSFAELSKDMEEALEAVARAAAGTAGREGQGRPA